MIDDIKKIAINAYAAGILDGEEHFYKLKALNERGPGNAVSNNDRDTETADTKELS